VADAARGAAGVSVRLLEGDCRELLPRLPTASVHCVVTSPPYWGLRDYGVTGQLGLEPTPEAYVEAMVGIFREVRRVLRDDATLWLNMGDSYAGSSQTGGEGRETITGGTRNQQASMHAFRRGLGGYKPKDLVGIPWRLAFALQADGWYLRADIIWAKPNPMPESVTDRPTKAHEYVFLLSKSARYFYDADAVREPAEYGFRPTKGGDIFDRVGNGGRSPRKTPGVLTYGGDASTGRNLRSVWTLATEPTPEAHFATFPTALASRCILAGSRMGDTVLDPFAGTGTVGAVAEQLGRHSVLIELSPAYVRLADRRTAQLGLFTQGATA
jgi:DNA modification methylase